MTLPRAENRGIIAKFYGIPEQYLLEERSVMANQIATIAHNYQTRPIMMHEHYWAEAEKLQKQIGCLDLSELFTRLLQDARNTKK